MEKVLIVDFDAGNRIELSDILCSDYDVELASNGREAVDIIDKKGDELAVILYRFSMQDIDGYRFLEIMQEKKILENTPVLFVNERFANELESNDIKMGVYDFIHKPFVGEIVRRRVRNFADLFVYKNGLEEKVSSQGETMTKQFRLLKIQSDELRKSKEKIVDILGTVVECRSLESGDHITRIKGYTGILARRVMNEYPEYALNNHKIEVIESASALHDIGKIAIPDSILNKPGKLTKDEFEFMKSHTIRGADIINNIRGVWDDEYAKVSYEICRYHHERYDGKGYPDGIKGDDIPISAQCESIADVYDALVTESVYKAAYSKEEAFDMIVQGECGVFSPKLMECFRKSRDQFEEFLDKQRKAD